MFLSHRRHVTLSLAILALGLFLSFVAGSASSAFAATAETVGTVTRVHGDAFAINGTERRPLMEGTVLGANDTVLTKDAARLQITMTDGAVLSLGANAAMLLSDVIATRSPAPRGPVMTLIRGAFLLAAPKTLGAEIKTPVATIGIRGTRLWGGPLDNAMDILLLEGKIDVRNKQGTVILDQAGEGTMIPKAGDAPHAPTLWSGAKTARAISSVSF